MTVFARCCHDIWGNYYSPWWWLAYAGAFAFCVLVGWLTARWKRHRRRRHW